MQKRLFVFLASVGTVSAALANTLVADPSTFLGPRSSGRGGATVASNLTHDSLFQNPASAAFWERYSINVGYAGYGDSLAASIVDTKSGPLGGGVYYMKRDLKFLSSTNTGILGNVARDEEIAGFAFMGKVQERLAVGLGGRYQSFKSKVAGVPSAREWNFDFGARWLAMTGVNVGVAAQNLVSKDNAIYPKMYTYGLEYQPYPGVALSAQGRVVQKPKAQASGGASLPFNSSSGWNAGAEWQLPSGPVFRAGYIDATTWQEKFVTAGLGYESPEFSVDYAAIVGDEKKSGVSHNVMLSMFF